jgi:hypothetical protein
MAELTTLADTIVEMGRELGDISLQHELPVCQREVRHLVDGN